MNAPPPLRNRACPRCRQHEVRPHCPSKTCQWHKCGVASSNRQLSGCGMVIDYTRNRGGYFEDREGTRAWVVVPLDAISEEDD